MLDEVLRAGAAVPVVDGDACTAHGEGEGCGRADALRCTRHERDHAVERARGPRLLVLAWGPCCTRARRHVPKAPVPDVQLSSLLLFLLLWWHLWRTPGTLRCRCSRFSNEVRVGAGRVVGLAFGHTENRNG